MRTKKIEFNEECPSCKGTGLYTGFAEASRCAVICTTCNGTGCSHFVYTYTPFTRKKRRKGIDHVYAINPGIWLGQSEKYKHSDFGGVSYKEWLRTKTFPPKSECRNFTCPAWWYQNADSRKKPKWKECIAMGCFNGCPNFRKKEKCWEKFDSEQRGR